MARLLSARRMASTAAWSAAFSSPRPMSRDAESAAASVTRTASRARLRSIAALSAMFPSPDLEFLDADHARRLEHGVEPPDPFECAAHGRLFCLMCGEHHRHRLARRAAALDHLLHRDLLVAQRRGDVGDHAGPVDDHEADIA